MGVKTGIQWTDKTWNPTVGCTKVSAGCKNCYAETFIERFGGKSPAFPDGFGLTLKPHKLGDPRKWKTPSKIFVNSLSDLFHEDVPDEYIERVFEVMADCPHHTFQVLTKRPERMREWMKGYYWRTHFTSLLDDSVLPNVWLGVSVENCKTVDRISILKEVPAAVHFVSFEPLLEDVVSGHLADIVAHELGWAIIGGESGPGARPCRVEWIETLVKFLNWHRVPTFVKQLGSVCASELGLPKGTSEQKKGGDWDVWPESLAHLKVREFPAVRHA